MEEKKIANEIRDNDYLRKRMSPRPNDFYYLSLSDLRLALDQVKSDETLDILDYGCGGSPYKELFPNSNYRRADYLQADDEDGQLDYILEEDSRVPEADGSFDMILSTQVAEHLKFPGVYLSECFRLLRPNGKLVLTTHGSFPDHGCPFDFQRWTADGLQRDLVFAGFDTESINKLTAGSRAFFSILDFSNSSLSLPPTTLNGALLYIVLKFFSVFRSSVYRQLDNSRSFERIVSDNDTQHTIYIGLMAVAKKV